MNTGSGLGRTSERSQPFGALIAEPGISIMEQSIDTSRLGISPAPEYPFGKALPNGESLKGPSDVGNAAEDRRDSAGFREPGTSFASVGRHGSLLVPQHLRWRPGAIRRKSFAGIWTGRSGRFPDLSGSKLRHAGSNPARWNPFRARHGAVLKRHHHDDEVNGDSGERTIPDGTIPDSGAPRREQWRQRMRYLLERRRW